MDFARRGLVALAYGQKEPGSCRSCSGGVVFGFTRLSLGYTQRPKITTVLEGGKAQMRISGFARVDRDKVWTPSLVPVTIARTNQEGKGGWKQTVTDVEDAISASPIHLRRTLKWAGGILLLCSLIPAFHAVVLKVFFEYLLFYKALTKCDFRERHYSITLLCFATRRAKPFVDIEPHTDYLKDSLRRWERSLIWHRVSIIPTKDWLLL